jgi:hypothetical protein
MRTLIILLEKQFRCGTMELIKYRFLYANPSRYMSSASDIFYSITSVMFPNSKDAD